MQGPNSFARIAYRTLSATAIVLLSAAAAQATDEDKPFLPQLIVSSTIPTDGDLNPYGVAFIPEGFPGGGALLPGDVLVSNFNNNGNLQGTGTTIIKFTPTGTLAPSVTPGQNGNAITFFQSNLAGLTTALGVLQRGFVLVGNVPTMDGTTNTISQGALQVLDRHGNLLETLSDAKFLDSPWDLTIHDNGAKAQVFVSNVLSGTVSRLDVAVSSKNVTVLNKTQIAIGYTHEPNQAALVLGPTGLAYDPQTDILYVASTADNAIFAVSHAGKATAPVVKGTTVFADSHLRGPLALVFAPNGHLLTANGDAVNADPTHPSEIIEFTKTGKFIREFNVDASQGGSFGIATVLSGGHGFNFAAVDDVPNVISVYSLPVHHDWLDLP
jgi:DNA-binding beta-propeller fold protein YncE